jgi:glutamate-1-semialdehyde 2,1-aminomutase
VRFCSSGSEATLHLIRACRAFTGRKKIIRVEGTSAHELISSAGSSAQALAANRPPYLEPGRDSA